MHVEIDTWEIGVLIVVWFLAKWLFRIAVVVVMAKIVSKLVAEFKKQGKEALENVKSNIGNGNKSGSNDEDGNE